MDLAMVYAARGPRGAIKRYAMDSSGRVYEIRGHRPWFLADRCPRGAVACRESTETIMVWDDAAMTYRPGPRAVRVEAGHPSDVPRLLEAVEGEGGVASFANVRYEARLSLDVYDGSRTMLGAKAPVMVYYGGDEYAQVLAEVYERARRDLVIAAVDIEVESRSGGFPRPGDPVFIVSVAPVRGGEVGDPVILEGDEVHELPRVVRRLGAHIVAGFNSSGFDARYYSAYVGRETWTRDILDADGRPVPHIDLMEFLDAHGAALGLSEGRRYALDDAAEALGLAAPEELEIESAVDRSQIAKLYRENRELVLRYAGTDAVLTARLAAYVVPVLAVLAALTGVSVPVIPRLPSLGSIAEYAVYEAVRRTEGLVYQLRRRRYRIEGLPEAQAPSIVYTNRYKDYYTRPVYAEDVAEYDFNMLYPSIYADQSLGPHARLDDEGFPLPLVDAETGGVRWVRIRGDPRDPVARVLTRVYDARRATKKLKKERGIEAPDQAVKILANSAYGMYSKGRGMGLHEGVSAYIFFYANQVMDRVVKWLESRGLRVVYTATDSLFVLGARNPAELEEELNQWIADNIGDRYSVKLEAVFKRFALIKKKTYAGETADGSVVVKGAEKLQIPYAVKTSIEDYFRRVLAGEEPSRVLDGILSAASDQELMVRTSKYLSAALWDEDEQRWKTINNRGMRALVLTYMLTEGRTRLVVSQRDLGDLEFTVVAWWLPLTPSRVLLDTPRGRYNCRLAARTAGEQLVLEADCMRASPSRRDLERLARRASGPVLDYGRIVQVARAGTGQLTLKEWIPYII